jgi:hypothetical protein
MKADRVPSGLAEGGHDDQQGVEERFVLAPLAHGQHHRQRDAGDGLWRRRPGRVRSSTTSARNWQARPEGSQRRALSEAKLTGGILEPAELTAASMATGERKALRRTEACTRAGRAIACFEDWSYTMNEAVDGMTRSAVPKQEGCCEAAQRPPSSRWATTPCR